MCLEISRISKLHQNFINLNQSILLEKKNTIEICIKFLSSIKFQFEQKYLKLSIILDNPLTIKK